MCQQGPLRDQPAWTRRAHPRHSPREWRRRLRPLKSSSPSARARARFSQNSSLPQSRRSGQRESLALPGAHRGAGAENLLRVARRKSRKAPNLSAGIAGGGFAWAHFPEPWVLASRDSLEATACYLKNSNRLDARMLWPPLCIYPRRRNRRASGTAGGSSPPQRPH